MVKIGGIFSWEVLGNILYVTMNSIAKNVVSHLKAAVLNSIEQLFVALFYTS